MIDTRSLPIVGSNPMLSASQSGWIRTLDTVRFKSRLFPENSTLKSLSSRSLRASRGACGPNFPESLCRAVRFACIMIRTRSVMQSGSWRRPMLCAPYRDELSRLSKYPPRPKRSHLDPESSLRASHAPAPSLPETAHSLRVLAAQAGPDPCQAGAARRPIREAPPSAEHLTTGSPHRCGRHAASVRSQARAKQQNLGRSSARGLPAHPHKSEVREPHRGQRGSR